MFNQIKPNIGGNIMYFEKGDEAVIKVRQGYKLRKITVAQLEYLVEREKYKNHSPFAEQSGKRTPKCNKTTVLQYLVDNALTDDERQYILDKFRRNEGIS